MSYLTAKPMRDFMKSVTFLLSLFIFTATHMTHSMNNSSKSFDRVNPNRPITRSQLSSSKQVIDFPFELHHASQQGHTERARFLLKLKKNPNLQDINGNTRLHFAALRCHIDIVRLLLESKASPNIQNINGSTALHVATREGHLGIVQLLLDYKAKEKLNIQKETPTDIAYGMAKNISDSIIINITRGIAIDDNRHDENKEKYKTYMTIKRLIDCYWAESCWTNGEFCTINQKK